MTQHADTANSLDETHSASLRCWVPGANGHADFPIQNLPFGIVSPKGGNPRAAVAIGDRALDLQAALAAGVFGGDARRAVEAMSGDGLNAFLALGAVPRKALRARLSALFREGAPERPVLEPLLLDCAECDVRLPARIGDYTDFYVGIHHATHVGQLFRPHSPLMPNYKWVPIGYHGRSSSILPSGRPIRRPVGQAKAAADSPTFAASTRLDHELELGVWIGPGNEQGESVAIGDAASHIAGYCLLNDWSARDFQTWEYQPLGPFLSKNFATTISCWIVTPEALAPFRSAQPARPAGDPAPLPYLYDPQDQTAGALQIELEVLLVTPEGRKRGLNPYRLSLSNANHMYWTPAQMVTHHASGGCNLNPGDLLGTGTISGPRNDGAGALVESTEGGANRIMLATGETRTFLEDGDEVIMVARCRRPGFASIGFGECRAAVLPAREVVQ